MSAEASIPTPPLPGKDPPLETRPSLPSPSPAPPPSPPLPGAPQLTSKSMDPPPKPHIQTASTTTLPLQSSKIPPTPSSPRPSFSPFFTLINDATTQSTHHPSKIHYIFSDDDETEVLTAACIKSLQQDNEDDNPAGSRDMGSSEQGVRESETSSSSSATFRKGGERRIDKPAKAKAPVKREERAIIVDVNERGDGIISTSSLSSCWQVINADIMNAPTFNNANTGDSAAEEGERGLMLKIEGVGIAGSAEGELGDSGEKRKGKGVAESSVMTDEEMQTLLEGFDRKMGLLRRIVASGESWDEARKERDDGDCDGDSGKEI